MMLAVFILLAAGLLLNKLFQIYALKNLTCTREISKSVLEIKEEFEVSIIVENKKVLPVTFLQIEEKIHKSLQYVGRTSVSSDRNYLYHWAKMAVMPYQRIKRTYRMYPTKRGKYYFYDINMHVGDLIGIKNFNKEIESLQQVIVLPKKLNLKESIVPYGGYNGDVSVKRWIIEDPILMLGVREYTGFEPMRNIHWLISLKTGKLMVRNFDYTTDSRVIVCLNIEAYKPFWMNIDSDRIEKCISMARSIFEELEDKGIPYGLTTNAQMSQTCNDCLTGLGSSHLSALLEMLGSIEYGIACSFEEHLSNLILYSSIFTTYIIITPDVFEEYIQPINNLSKNSQKLITIALNDKNLEYLDGGIISYIDRGGEY